MDDSRQQLICGQCGWSTVCDIEAMVDWLRGVRMLLREGEPAPLLVLELFTSAAARFTCPECGRCGLAANEADGHDDPWGGGRACEGCGKPIPLERLEALSGVTRCAACQESADNGQDDEVPDYCPGCGSIMELRRSNSGGLTRYLLVCPACRRRSG